MSEYVIFHKIYHCLEYKFFFFFKPPVKTGLLYLEFYAIIEVGKLIYSRNP